MICIFNQKNTLKGPLYRHSLEHSINTPKRGHSAVNHCNQETCIPVTVTSCIYNGDSMPRPLPAVRTLSDLCEAYLMYHFIYCTCTYSHQAKSNIEGLPAYSVKVV